MSFWKRLFGGKDRSSSSKFSELSSSAEDNTSPIQFQSKRREVRVFVSSTFRDMKHEREYLVKFTFPELRKLCRERGIEFSEVDLRWGVTDEQKAEGKVLPICLAEIERCSPYFIGVLGARYGWVPEEADDKLEEIQPWLKQHREKSITELEIIHGVLESPEMEGVSFFYFRDPQISEQIEKEILNEEGYKPEEDESLDKLKKLKEEILKHEKNYPVPVRMNFPNAEELGQQVLEDLWTAISERFPKEEVPSALERERLDHEAFAEARRKVYIGRDEYFKRLDDHVKSEDPPLVILGESGSGKSALIANWVARYRQSNPDEFIITYFIGSTSDSADYVRLLRQIMEEIQERYEPETKDHGSIPPLAKGGEGGFSDEIPTDPKKVVEAFPQWIAKASAKGKLVLILDALNQLDDKDNARELGWLPVHFPPNIKVILSTLPGKSLDALNRRNLPSMKVELLTIDEKMRLIPEYLQRFTKTLEKEHVELIANAEHTNNPLYLKALLDELRYHGEHFTLKERIRHYLEAETVDDLYERILERYERDYEKERTNLVKDAMSLVWASRRGLTERELLQLLRSADDPLPNAIWSPLYLAAEESLVSQSGLFSFSHDFLRKAVEDRYLRGEDAKKEYHLKIADYFDKQKELTERKADELPWQLCESGSWERLKDCITDAKMFLNLGTDKKQYEHMGYWLRLESIFDMVSAHNEMIEEYEKGDKEESDLAFLLNATAFFLDLNARYEGAEPLFRRTLAIFEKVLGREHSSTAQNINSLALLLYSKGDYEGAEPLFRRSLEIREKVLGRDHPDTAGSINNLALLLRSTGDYEGAEPLFRRAIEISEKMLGRDHPDTANSLNNLAGVLNSKGDYEGAEPLHRRALEISEKVLGREHPDTARSLNNLASSLTDKKDYEGAEPLIRRALKIKEKVLGREHPDTATSIGNLASLLTDKRDYEGAEPLHRRALEIREKVLGREHPDTARSLNNLASSLTDKRDYEGAEPLYRRALAIFEKVLGRENPSTQTVKDNLDALLKKKKKFWWKFWK